MPHGCLISNERVLSIDWPELSFGGNSFSPDSAFGFWDWTTLASISHAPQINPQAIITGEPGKGDFISVVVKEGLSGLFMTKAKAKELGIAHQFGSMVGVSIGTYSDLNLNYQVKRPEFSSPLFAYLHLLRSSAPEHREDSIDTPLPTDIVLGLKTVLGHFSIVDWPDAIETDARGGRNLKVDFKKSIKPFDSLHIVRNLDGNGNQQCSPIPQ